VGVVEGVELGLRRFTRNEKARLRVASKLAYGHDGCPAFDIPPDADVDYEIELQDFVKVYSRTLCLFLRGLLLFSTRFTTFPAPFCFCIQFCHGITLPVYTVTQQL